MAFLAAIVVGAAAVAGTAIVLNEAQRYAYYRANPPLVVTQPVLVQPVVVGVADAYAPTSPAASSSYPPQASKSQACLSMNDPHGKECQFGYAPVEYTHSLFGLNYPWLDEEFGPLVKTEFLEGQSGWVDYEQLHRTKSDPTLHTWWIEHCRAVSHEPSKLYATHMKAFVNEGRFAVLRFTFANGAVYRSDYNQDAFDRFYRLEENYHRKQCQSKHASVLL
jgi:hypothetical protein